MTVQRVVRSEIRCCGLHRLHFPQCIYISLKWKEKAKPVNIFSWC